MSTIINQSDLESYLWGAANILRGGMDAGDYKQYIFPLLFFKRICDVHDEEYEKAVRDFGGDEESTRYDENYTFQVPEDAHWKIVRNTPTNVGQAIQSSIRSIEQANPNQLYGIFGDSQWTYKERLPDRVLKNLIEHFSSQTLSLKNLPEDQMGNGYEYLIKKFADDSGHTAAEFYTNRTLVKLMIEILQPESGDSVYDPTCGSGGMLLSSIVHLKENDKEYRNLQLYGQEAIPITTSIARMNLFLHGIVDFHIEGGDTLSEPKFVEGDHLKQFDIILANPPYSIKQWNRSLFASDPWGRNRYGTPPQGRADYAFLQHILASLKPDSGRCAILFPHGVLFRKEEKEMRAKIVEDDLIECVIGLGPNLFYNSPMEACIVICRTNKPAERKKRILFIDAVNEIIREHAQSYLKEEHVVRIADAYHRFKNIEGFCQVASLKEISEIKYNLTILRYVRPLTQSSQADSVQELGQTIDTWHKSSLSARVSVDALWKILKENGISE